MRKIYKLMIIENIVIQPDQTCHAKDISRVKMKISEDGDPSKSHTLKQYATIKQNSLFWTQHFQFKYKGQTKITFQTYCQHEYGYKLEELQVLYRGVYHLSNQNFFKKDSCHIYSTQGEKKGLLKWQVKVVNRQQEQKVIQKIEQIKPLVREDLIGMIKIHQLTFQIINPIFNKKRYQHNLELKIKFDNEQYTKISNNYNWFFGQLKLEYIIGGSKNIDFQLLHDQRCILNGNSSCQSIQKMKRYIKYKVGMFNKNGIKIGSLILEYRYLQKQQLLDLIYSPNNKLKYIEKSKKTEYSQEDRYSEQKFITKSSMKLNSKKYILFNESPQHKTANRYQIGYLMNHNSDIFIAKSSRFQANKSNSPYVSYINPEKQSDFSPQRSKGWDMSRGTKFDFTRQYKNNPGVGSYKLPSIWSKY